MADRGRDLKFSILSDVSYFDLAKPADELEKLSTDVKAAGDDLDKFGRDAKTTASKVDNAFGQIAQSSRSNIRRKVDDDVNHAKHKLSEVKEEAHQTARESLASFTNAGSFQDAGQEIAANAGAIFGPLGLAIGGLLSIGIATFTGNWQAAKEKIKAQAGEITQALIDANGALDGAFVNSQIKKFVDDGTITQLAQQARDAQVPVGLFIRAAAGDPAAQRAINAELDNSRKQYGLNAAGSINAADAIAELDAKQAAARGTLGQYSEAVNLGTEAYNAFVDANGVPVVPRVDGSQAMTDSDIIHTGIKNKLGEVVYIPTKVAPPSASSLDAALSRARALAAVGITVPVNYSYQGMGVLRQRP